MGYEIKYSCTSHIGRVRSVNQDNLICNGKHMELAGSGMDFPFSGSVKSDVPTLFAIFDGMGGEECGEVASYLAVREASAIEPSGDSVLDLSEFCKRANRKICEYTLENRISSMGTTAAMLLCDKKGLTLCNIGDSKVFKFSKGELIQISEDHVVVAAYGSKAPLSQNLGIPEDQLLLEPYLSQGGYKGGDKYLISSDGLTDMVSLDEIKACLESKISTEEAVDILLQKSLENGGRDNISIILLEISSGGLLSKIKDFFTKEISDE